MIAGFNIFKANLLSLVVLNVLWEVGVFVILLPWFFGLGGFLAFIGGFLQLRTTVAWRRGGGEVVTIVTVLPRMTKEGGVGLWVLRGILGVVSWVINARCPVSGQIYEASLGLRAKLAKPFALLSFCFTASSWHFG